MCGCNLFRDTDFKAAFCEVEGKFIQNEYLVKFEYDNEAGVWIATSENVTGLILESESLDKLIERVLDVVPELVELNNLPKYSKIKISKIVA